VAATTLGTQLTELHYRQQVALRAQTLQQVLRLWPAVDVSTIDTVTSTWPAFEEALLTLIKARYGNSAGLAARYYQVFRAAEGIPGTAATLLADMLPDEQVITSIRVTGLYEARRQLALKSTDVGNQTLLASRGPVYKGTTVAFRAHDHCSCSSEPVFSRDQPWPGNSRRLRDLYDEVTADAKNSEEARSLFRQAVEAR
jgi:hypothetical protein